LSKVTICPTSASSGAIGSTTTTSPVSTAGAMLPERTT
jgi:hypothetical protein